MQRCDCAFSVASHACNGSWKPGHDVIVLGQNTPVPRRAPLKIIIEIIGWTAAVMMLSAYLLLTSGRLRSLSPAYQWLNVLSGAGFIVNSGWNGAYPSATLNLIWMAIGLYGLFRGARVQPGPAA
jgi:hypothetical protein